MLEGGRAGGVEQDVDDGALGRREDDQVDELLPLVPAAVAADQLHGRTGDGDVENTVFAVLVR